MKNKILYIFFIFCFSVSLSSLLSGENNPDSSLKNSKSSKDLSKAEFNNIKEEINSYKLMHGKTLYVGEGVVEVKKDVDFGQAIKISKQRAMADLLESIKVRIKADIRDELKFSEDGTTTEKFESIVNSYVDQILEIVHDKRYDDFPKPGIVTTIVFVDKKAYDEVVAKDIKIKTDKIKEYALAGIKAQKEKRILNAIENYVNGKIWLKNYFESLPVKAELTDDKTPQDIGTFLDTQLTQIFHSITLHNTEENIFYNTEGKINRKPTILVSYKDSSGEIPLADVPIKASFLKGSGIISTSKIRSDRRGYAIIPVEHIDPIERETVIQAELDSASLNLKEGQNLPAIFISVGKVKSAAWSVSLFRDGKRESPFSLSDSLRMLLESKGYEVKKLDIHEKEITEEVISKARDMNVDYIFYICIIAESQKDEYGMYQSIAHSRAYIYSLYNNQLIEAIEGPSKSGYSTSAAGASYTAMSKIKPGLMEILKEKIGRLNR